MLSDDFIISQFERLYQPETGLWHLPGDFNAAPFDANKIGKYLELPPHAAPIEREVGDFFASIVALLKPRTVLETGTNMGYSTAKLANALYKIHGASAKLYTIDMLDLCPIFRGMECSRIITEIRGNSHLCEIPEREFDMLALDSDHHYETIAGEIGRFDPYLRIGGSILFHDSVYFDGVGLAVKQLHNTGCYELITLPSPRLLGGNAARPPGVTIARKKNHLGDRFAPKSNYIGVDVDLFPCRHNDPAWIVDEAMI